MGRRKNGGQRKSGHNTHSPIFPEDEVKSAEIGGANRGRRRNGGTNELGIEAFS